MKKTETNFSPKKNGRNNNEFPPKNVAEHYYCNRYVKFLIKKVLMKKL